LLSCSLDKHDFKKKGRLTTFFKAKIGKSVPPLPFHLDKTQKPMAALNFKGMFVDPIEDGSKKQTIRAFRKYPIEPGERLFLYTGMRTKNCKKIGEAICSEIWLITIKGDTQFSFGPLDKIILMSPDENIRWEFNTTRQLNAFAKKDGFTGWVDMKEWWSGVYGLVAFQGVLIKWKSLL
jgi:hypothetical protein